MTSDVQPRWPRWLKPWTTAALLLSLLVGAAAVRLYVKRAHPLQRFYFWQYAKLETIGDGFIPSVKPGPKDGREAYEVVYVGQFPADDAALENEPGPVTKRVNLVHPEQFRLFLKDWIYGHESIWGWLLMPLIATVAFGSILMSVGAYMDRKYNVQTRNGRRLRGPGLVSRWKFNREVARATK